MTGFFGLGGGGGSDGDGSTLDEFGEPPRGRFGRLKYGTASRARQVAADLGLDGIHRHDGMGPQGQTIYMPGTNHKKLNKALRERGLAETPVPGKMNDSGSGSGARSSRSESNANTSSDDSALRPFGDVDEKPDGPMSSDALGLGLGTERPGAEPADTTPDQMDDLLPRMGSMGAPGGDVDEKPDGASDFALFGDSDDDGEMELYK